MSQSAPTWDDRGPEILNTTGDLSGVGAASFNRLVGRIFENEALKEYLRDTAKGETGLVSQDAFVEFCTKAMNAFYAETSRDADHQQEKARLDAYIGKTNAVGMRFHTANKPDPNAIYWPDPQRGDPLLKDVLPIVGRVPIIDQSTVISSAGSCFAIEIARNLMSRGFNYLCLENTFDPETRTLVMGSDPQNPEVQYSCRWGILFNTPSFTQIVENAFGVRPLPQILIDLQLRDSKYYIDPFREAVMFPSPEAYSIEREKHLANTREVFLKSEVFVMTLGLNEAWRLLPDGPYISRNPRNAALTGLLDHRTLTVAENVDYLQRFIDVVRAHNPNLKIIVTVSPVPLMATGRADKYHVIAANTHSKSVLRIAAEEIVERNDGVYYFPSYEVVTVCSPESWTEDQRHIHPDAVARVMKAFDAMFLTNAAKTLSKLG